MKVSIKCDVFHWFLELINICLKGRRKYNSLIILLKEAFIVQRKWNQWKFYFSLQLQPMLLYSIFSNCFLLMPSIFEQYLQQGRLDSLKVHKHLDCKSQDWSDELLCFLCSSTNNELPLFGCGQNILQGQKSNRGFQIPLESSRSEGNCLKIVKLKSVLILHLN